MRNWYRSIISGFQPEELGALPGFRSKKLCPGSPTGRGARLK